MCISMKLKDNYKEFDETHKPKRCRIKGCRANAKYYSHIGRVYTWICNPHNEENKKIGKIIEQLYVAVLGG